MGDIGIVSRLPGVLPQAISIFRQGATSPFLLVAMLGLTFLVIAVTIAVTQIQRKIPVQYAKYVVGRKTYGGLSTYMPLRVNYSGRLPVWRFCYSPLCRAAGFNSNAPILLHWKARQLTE